MQKVAEGALFLVKWKSDTFSDASTEKVVDGSLNVLEDSIMETQVVCTELLQLANTHQTHPLYYIATGDLLAALLDME
jgi:hypothetical protein